MAATELTGVQRAQVAWNGVVQKLKESLINDRPPGLKLDIGDMPTIQESKKLSELYKLSGFLPYESYDADSDMYFNKDSVGFVLDCMPSTGLTEQNLNVLNGIFCMQHPADATIQVTLYADPNVENLYDVWRQNKQMCANKDVSEIFSLLADNRIEYYKKGKWGSLFSDQSVLPKTYHLIVSYSAPVPIGQSACDISKNSMDLLLRLRESMQGALLSSGIPSVRMQPAKLINIMNGFLNPSAERQPYLQYDENTDISEQMVSEDTAVLFDSGMSSVVHNGERFSLLPFNVRQMPKQWIGYRNRDLIGSFTNNILRLPCPVMITMTITMPDQVSSKGNAKRKSMRATQMASSPITKYVPQWNVRKFDWDFAQLRLDDGDKLVEGFYQILLMTPEGREQMCEESLRGIYNNIGWSLTRSRYIPIPSFLGAIPLGVDTELLKTLRTLRHYSPYLSWTCTNMAPWIAEWKGTQNPLLMFLGRMGQLTFFDPFDNDKGNYNISCCAASGGGKSFFTNEWVFSCLGFGGRAFIIDAGHSYRELCRLLNGTYIDFGAGQPILNPFTNFFKREVLEELEAKGLSVKDYTDDHMPMLKLLIGQMASPERDLSSKQKSILEIAITEATRVYREKTTITSVAEMCLLIKDEKGEVEETARDLARMLHSYTKDGMYGRYFEGENNIDLNHPMVVLELDALNAKGDLQSVVLLILMMQINQVMYLSGNKKQRKLCIIDEAWRLLGRGRAGSFIEEGYRVARKHGGSFMTITQKVSDYHSSETAKAAYANSDFTIFLRQKLDELTAAEAKGYIDNSDGKVDVIRTIETKQGFYSELAIMSPGGMAVVRFIVDPVTEKVYSTKADEVEFLQTARKNGVNLFDAIQQLINKGKGRK